MSQASSAEDGRSPWREELVDIVRALSGGLLFGVPLLYTLEVWSTGSHTGPGTALAVLGITSVPVLILNRTAGFRTMRDVRWRDALMDTAEAMALGVASVTVILIIFDELNGRTPLGEALGKIVYEALPFCIGIGVAAHILRGGRDESDTDAGGQQHDADADGEHDGADADTEEDDADHGMNGTVVDLGATLIGAVIISLPIAPTDEVTALAAALDPPRLLALLGLTLVAGYGIVFVAGFSNEEQRHAQQGIFQRPLSETVAAYLVALGAAWAMLVLFQNTGGPWQETLSEVVVLGLPATIGGAAGRLVA